MTKLPVVRIYWPRWIWVMFKIYQYILLAGLNLKILSVDKALDSLDFAKEIAAKTIKTKVIYK